MDSIRSIHAWPTQQQTSKMDVVAGEMDVVTNKMDIVKDHHRSEKKETHPFVKGEWVIYDKVENERCVSHLAKVIEVDSMTNVRIQISGLIGTAHAVMKCSIVRSAQLKKTRQDVTPPAFDHVGSWDEGSYIDVLVSKIPLKKRLRFNHGNAPLWLPARIIPRSDRRAIHSRRHDVSDSVNRMMMVLTQDSLLCENPALRVDRSGVTPGPLDPPKLFCVQCDSEQQIKELQIREKARYCATSILTLTLTLAQRA